MHYTDTRFPYVTAAIFLVGLTDCLYIYLYMYYCGILYILQCIIYIQYRNKNVGKYGRPRISTPSPPRNKHPLLPHHKHSVARNILLANDRPEVRLITLDTFHRTVYTTPSTKLSANAKIITTSRPQTVTWG